VRRSCRLLSILVVLAVALAGCGGGSSSSKTGGDARAVALSYMPKGSVATIEIATGGGQVDTALKLLHRFPGAELLLGRLSDEVTKGTSLSYDKDIKPALGNPFVLAPVSIAAEDFVGAIVATDAKKAERFVSGNGAKAGSRSGVDVYRDRHEPNTFYGLKGSTVIFADGRANLDAAIDRHAKGTGAKPDDGNALMTGLPGDALLKVYGLVAPVIANDPGAAAARRVPFVAALKGYGVAVTAAKDGVNAAFRVDTSNAKLAAADQPLSPGARPAPTAAAGPIDIGLRDLSHTVAFAIRLGQRLDPNGFQQFGAGLDVIKARTGVDVVRDVIDQLGDAAISTDTHLFAVRAKARNANTLRLAVAKLLPIVPAFLDGAGLPGVKPSSGPGGLILLRRDGHYVAGYGVVAGQFVVGNAPPTQLLQFARRPATTEPGTTGAATVRGSTPQLVRLILNHIDPQLVGAALFLGRLGNLVGSASEDAGAITGKLTLPVK
jgi:hypothetical protein